MAYCRFMFYSIVIKLLLGSAPLWFDHAFMCLPRTEGPSSLCFYFLFLILKMLSVSAHRFFFKISVSSEKWKTHSLWKCFPEVKVRVRVRRVRVRERKTAASGEWKSCCQLLLVITTDARDGSGGACCQSNDCLFVYFAFDSFAFNFFLLFFFHSSRPTTRPCFSSVASPFGFEFSLCPPKEAGSSTSVLSSSHCSRSRQWSEVRASDSVLCVLHCSL